MSREDERLDIGDASADHPVAIPSELPLLPLRDTVLFPNSFLPLAVARESSVRLIEEAIELSTQRGVLSIDHQDPAGVMPCLHAPILEGVDDGRESARCTQDERFARVPDGIADQRMLSAR